MDINRISGYIPGKMVFFLMQVSIYCIVIVDVLAAFTAAYILFDKESGQNASRDIPLLQRNQQQFNLQKITSQNRMAADLQSWGGTYAQDLVLAPW